MSQELEKRMAEQLHAEGFNLEHSAAIAHVRAREERGRTGKIVIKKSEREWSSDKMGANAFYYLDHIYEDSATMDWRVFKHGIGSQSGKHRHQGGLALFALKGRGATTYDGERIEWEKGDLLILPVKPNGIEHQHFDYDGDAEWIALYYIPVLDAVATDWTLLEERKGWREESPPPGHNAKS